MRASLILVILVAGCVAAPQPAIPVVQVGNTLTRHLADGSVWNPGHGDGCLRYSVDVEERRVRIYDADLQESPGAQAVVFRSLKSPEDDTAVLQASFPTTLPAEYEFKLGNVRNRSTSLVVEARSVTFNGAAVRAGDNVTERFDYQWRRADGVLLNVTELVHLQFAGIWPDPVERRDDPCP